MFRGFLANSFSWENGRGDKLANFWEGLLGIFGKTFGYILWFPEERLTFFNVLWFPEERLTSFKGNKVNFCIFCKKLIAIRGKRTINVQVVRFLFKNKRQHEADPYI